MPILPSHPRPGPRPGSAGRRGILSLALGLALLGTARVPAEGVFPPPASPDPLPPPAAAARVPGEAELLVELAARGTNFARLYQLADLCHDAGADGDKHSALRAEVYVRQALGLEPTNAPALALLGSIYTIKGRDAFWPTQQLRLVREGNGIMDEAIRRAPEDYRVRLLRAFNNAHMPDFLGRTEVVRADLAWLWEKAEKEPDHFTVGEKQEISLHWGRQLKRQRRTEEARRVWEFGRSLAADSRRGTQLAAELAKLR